MVNAREVGAALLLLTVACCGTPASYQSDMTNYVQGVTALEGANDALLAALSNQLRKEQTATWLRLHPRVLLQDCLAIPGPGIPNDKLRPCVVVSQDQAPGPPVTGPEAAAPCVAGTRGLPPGQQKPAEQTYVREQAYLVRSKECLELVRKYAVALVALASSTDAASAATDTQAIGQSLNGIATAAGNQNANAKTPASAAAGAAGVPLAIFSFALSEWQFQKLKDTVISADQSVNLISKSVGVWMRNAQEILIYDAYGDVDRNEVHVIDPGYRGTLSAADYQKQLTLVQQTADYINLVRSSDVIGAAEGLGKAHTALANALRSGTGLAGVSDAIANFLTAATKAQTVLQQASTPVAIPS